MHWRWNDIEWRYGVLNRAVKKDWASHQTAVKLLEMDLRWRGLQWRVRNTRVPIRVRPEGDERVSEGGGVVALILTDFKDG